MSRNGDLQHACLRKIFLEALEHGSRSARDAYVEEQCKGDLKFHPTSGEGEHSHRFYLDEETVHSFLGSDHAGVERTQGFSHDIVWWCGIGSGPPIK